MTSTRHYLMSLMSRLSAVHSHLTPHSHTHGDTNGNPFSALSDERRLTVLTHRERRGVTLFICFSLARLKQKRQQCVWWKAMDIAMAIAIMQHAWRVCSRFRSHNRANLCNVLCVRGVCVMISHDFPYMRQLCVMFRPRHQPFAVYVSQWFSLFATCKGLDRATPYKRPQCTNVGSGWIFHYLDDSKWADLHAGCLA
jgi:hypothetical protein